MEKATGMNTSQENWILVTTLLNTTSQGISVFTKTNKAQKTEGSQDDLHSHLNSKF